MSGEVPQEGPPQKGASEIHLSGGTKRCEESVAEVEQGSCEAPNDGRRPSGVSFSKKKRPARLAEGGSKEESSPRQQQCNGRGTARGDPGPQGGCEQHAYSVPVGTLGENLGNTLHPINIASWGRLLDRSVRTLRSDVDRLLSTLLLNSREAPLRGGASLSP